MHTKCKRCGTCCRWSYFRFNTATELTTLLKLRGAEMVDGYTIRVPLVCSKLDPLTNMCTMYDDRPSQCKAFPEDGGLRPKECKYGEE